MRLALILVLMPTVLFGCGLGDWVFLSSEQREAVAHAEAAKAEARAARGGLLAADTVEEAQAAQVRVDRAIKALDAANARLDASLDEPGVSVASTADMLIGFLVPGLLGAAGVAGGMYRKMRKSKKEAGDMVAVVSTAFTAIEKAKAASPEVRALVEKIKAAHESSGLRGISDEIVKTVKKNIAATA